MFQLCGKARLACLPVRCILALQPQSWLIWSRNKPMCRLEPPSLPSSKIRRGCTTRIYGNLPKHCAVQYICTQDRGAVPFYLSRCARCACCACYSCVLTVWLSQVPTPSVAQRSCLRAGPTHRWTLAALPAPSQFRTPPPLPSLPSF